MSALARVNFVATVVVGTLLLNRMRTQGHGVNLALSSVAAARVSNLVYGSTKGGLDASLSGRADSLVGTGVSLLVVRSRFVRLEMTDSFPAAPWPRARRRSPTPSSTGSVAAGRRSACPALCAG